MQGAGGGCPPVSSPWGVGRQDCCAPRGVVQAGTRGEPPAWGVGCPPTPGLSGGGWVRKRVGMLPLRACTCSSPPCPTGIRGPAREMEADLTWGVSGAPGQVCSLGRAEHHRPPTRAGKPVARSLWPCPVGSQAEGGLGTQTGCGRPGSGRGVDLQEGCQAPQAQGAGVRLPGLSSCHAWRHGVGAYEMLGGSRRVMLRSGAWRHLVGTLLLFSR